MSCIFSIVTIDTFYYLIRFVRHCSVILLSLWSPSFHCTTNLPVMCIIPLHPCPDRFVVWLKDFILPSSQHRSAHFQLVSIQIAALHLATVWFWINSTPINSMHHLFQPLIRPDDTWHAPVFNLLFYSLHNTILLKSVVASFKRQTLSPSAFK